MLDSFISIEMDVSNINSVDIVLYTIICALTILFVRRFGPISIKSYEPESLYSTDNAPINVLYRIVAPTVWTFALILFISSITKLVFHISLFPSLRWLPVAAYWIVMFLKKTGATPQTAPISAIFIEGLISLSIAIYFDWAVVDNLANAGILAIDQSNVGFQIVLAALLVTSQMIANIIIRYNAKHNTTRPSRESNLEKALKEELIFRYKQKFEHLLPTRYSEDPLLSAFLFSIMIIEDRNRPALIRTIERAVSRFGLANTTGIMQQKSRRALSDVDSVRQAIPTIEAIWDSFLKQYAKQTGGILFTRTWYSYDYEQLCHHFKESFSYMYGLYCGTYTLDVSFALEEMLDFQKRLRLGFSPHIVYVEKNLFPAESMMLQHEILYWKDSDTIAFYDDAKADVFLTSLIAIDESEAIAKLKLAQREGHVVCVKKHLPFMFKIGLSNSPTNESLEEYGKWKLTVEHNENRHSPSKEVLKPY